MRHQDVYPARGDDRWVAITAFDDEDLARLEALTGGRPIGEWTREQDEVTLVNRLQNEGIAAGVVQDIEDLLERDPALRARGALVELPHPKLGAFGHVRTPISFSDSVVTPYRAPGMGEHTREIALAEAGLGPDRLSVLEDEGVLK